MKLLIDTNIVLDVLLKRDPFYQNAVNVMNLAQYDDSEAGFLNCVADGISFCCTGERTGSGCLKSGNVIKSSIMRYSSLRCWRNFYHQPSA